MCDEKWLLGNPIVEVDIYGKGGYKNIINQLSYSEYDVITIPEYNKKIVKYANRRGITVEDELEFLPSFFENKFKRRFYDFGPLDLGVIFSQEDARLAEKVIRKITKYTRFLTVPDYPRCNRLADSILKSEGLRINIENSIDKIKKKCDIILDLKTLELIV